MYSSSERGQLYDALEHVPKFPWFPSVTTGRYCSTNGWAKSLDSAHNEGWSKEPIRTECTSALLIFWVAVLPLAWLKNLCAKRKYKKSIIVNQLDGYIVWGTYYQWTIRVRCFGKPVMMLLLIVEFCNCEVGCVGMHVHLTILRLVMLRNTWVRVSSWLLGMHHFVSPNQMVRDIWVFNVPPHNQFR